MRRVDDENDLALVRQAFADWDGMTPAQRKTMDAMVDASADRAISLIWELVNDLKPVP